MILDKAIQRIHDGLAKGLMDKKLLVKGGWALYRAQVMPHDVSDIQLRETRQAFYAGAQHVLACVMVSLDPGTEPTDDDLQRMDYLHEELEEFANEMFARQQSAPKGNA